MSFDLNFALILTIILIINSSVNCQNKSESSVTNSRMTRIVERNSENIRQWLCIGDGITPEQWAKLKSECIDPRIDQLVPVSQITFIVLFATKLLLNSCFYSILYLKGKCNQCLATVQRNY